MTTADIWDGLNIEAPTNDGYFSLKKFLENNDSVRPVSLGKHGMTLGKWADDKLPNYRAPEGSIWRSRQHCREVFVSRRGLEEVVRIARTEGETHTRNPGAGDDWAPLRWVKQQVDYLNGLFDKLNGRVVHVEELAGRAIDAEVLSRKLDDVTSPLYQEIHSKAERSAVDALNVVIESKADRSTFDALAITVAAQGDLIRTLQTEIETLKKRRGWF